LEGILYFFHRFITFSVVAAAEEEAIVDGSAMIEDLRLHRVAVMVIQDRTTSRGLVATQGEGIASGSTMDEEMEVETAMLRARDRRRGIRATDHQITLIGGTSPSAIAFPILDDDNNLSTVSLCLSVISL
jgi:hypothetical protein